jgi:hypothetical protein
VGRSAALQKPMPIQQSSVRPRQAANHHGADRRQFLASDAALRVSGGVARYFLTELSEIPAPGRKQRRSQRRNERRGLLEPARILIPPAKTLAGRRRKPTGPPPLRGFPKRAPPAGGYCAPRPDLTGRGRATALW